ncbi:MAG: AAA family ATPase [Burkholderiales bacterium]|nr:AAA family ATPase [Burkholderiales bacterium]
MIVIVSGPSGAGKSTIGRALAAELDWRFFEGDDFHSEANKARMKAGRPLGDAERAPWLLAIAESIARQVRERSDAVYACSALKRAYRKALVLPRTPRSCVRFVLLHADRDVLARRLERRGGHFFPPALLDSQLADLEDASAGEEVSVLSVDATPSVGEVVRRIREGLRLSPSANG